MAPYPASAPSPSPLRGSPPSPARGEGFVLGSRLMPDRSFLAWPFFDERHRALAATLEGWTAQEIAPLAHDESDVDALSRRLVALLGDAGWLRYCVPKAQGGHFDKLDVRSLCLIRET